MEKEQAQVKIRETLEKMGATDIVFSPSEENIIVATFNSQNVTSFVADLPGWFYAGIQLDPTQNRQYKIDFKRLTPSGTL